MDTKDASGKSQPNSTAIPPVTPVVPAGSTVLPHNPLPGEPSVTIPVSTPPSSSGVPKSHKKLFIIMAAVITSLIVLIGGAGATLAAVAYDKISLGNPELEDKISQLVIGMPFMPKTPTYILESSAIAHSKHTKHAFNLSLSAEGDEKATATLGMNKFDVEAKGDIDYTDPKNVMFSINASITKDFNIDIRKKDAIAYFKVNKIPALLYSYAQLEQAKAEPIITQWIQYDTSTLDTEARRTLDEQKTEGDSITDEYLENTLDDLLAQNILEKMKVSETEVDGIDTYLFDLDADDKTIDAFVYRMSDRAEGKEDLKTLRTNDVKPSAYIKDLKLKMWIEKGSYLVRKVSTTFVYDQAGLYPNQESMIPSTVLGVSTDVLGIEDMMMGSAQAKYTIATVVSLSDFGKEIKVETPEKSLKIEEIVNQLMGVMGGGTGGPINPQELTMRSRDAARLTDLANTQQAINVSVQESNEIGASVLCSLSKKYPCSGISTSGIDARKADGNGWIKVNLQTQKSVSVPVLPVDPVNDDKNHYAYCANDNNWEINTVLESEQQKPKMANDGGDDDTKYEVGSNLELIGKSVLCRY